MSALVLAGLLMFSVGGLAILVGARPPYNDRQQLSAMIEKASAGARVLCELGAAVFAIGLSGFLFGAK